VKKRRIFSALLALLLLVSSLVPTAAAAPTSTPRADTHSTDAHECEHCNGNITWEPLNQTAVDVLEDGTLKFLNGKHHYYLEEDVELKQAVSCYVVQSKSDIVICLNGHTITLDPSVTGSEMSAINVKGTLTIMDCTAYTDASGVYHAGQVVGKGAELANQCHFATVNGTVNLYDGILSKFGATDAPVFNMMEGSLLNMYGGEISGNLAGNRAGAVWLQKDGSVFNMYGGTIKDNLARFGGAVYMLGANCAFNMYGGLIAGNRASKEAEPNATSGGSGAAIFISKGTFTYNGGEITQNTGTATGSAILAGRNGAVVLNATRIHGNTPGDKQEITVSGSLTDNRIFDHHAHERSTHDCEHCDAASVQWTALTGLTSVALTGSHHYYLTQDVAMADDAGLTVPTEADIVICLNGYKITNAPTITVEGKLTIADCAAHRESDGYYVAGSIEGSGKNRAFTVAENGKLGLYEGTVKGFKSDNGGAVSVSGTFTMAGGDLAENNATGNGGAVEVKSGATFTMSGGLIRDNTAAGNGGGVYMAEDLTVDMTSGEIRSNVAANGGGVYLAGKNTLNITGVISGNSATTKAGGVYGTAGSTVVINVGGRISRNAPGNVDPRSILDDKNAPPPPEEPSSNLHTTHKCDDCKSNEEWEVLTQEMADSQKIFDKSHHYYLESDIVLKQAKENYEILAGTEIHLCLNGHTLQIAMENDRSFIRVRGTLSIMDCTAKWENGVYSSGKMIGLGTEKQMRVAYVYGELNIYDGIFTDFYYNDNGGIAHVRRGTVNMYDGEIYGNRTDNSAGAIFLYNESTPGVFNMYGGVIRDNSAPQGAAVCVYSKGTAFNMYGGEIRDNKAEVVGGAVYVKPNGSFTMNGGTITGNSAVIGGGAVYGDRNSTVTLVKGTINGNTPDNVVCKGKLSDGSAPTEPTGPSKPVPKPSNEPYLPTGTKHTHVENSHTCEDCKATDWTEVSSESNLPTSGKHRVYLTADITLTKAWNVENGADITVCLNGYNIGQTKASTVLNGNAKLTITDCTAYTNDDGAYVAGAYYRNATANMRGFDFATNSNGAELNLYDGIITGFRSGGDGVVVLVGGYDTFNVYGGMITRNQSSSTTSGGAVYVKAYGSINVYGGVFSENAATNGGALAGAYRSHINVFGGTFDKNVATTGNGGAVYAYGNMDITGGSFTNNYACSRGGAIATTEWYSVGEWLTLKNATISGNYADVAGGGVWNGNGAENHIIMDKLTITNNETGGVGGGMCLIGSTVMSNLTITGNKAEQGGGIYFDTAKNDGHAYVVGYYTMCGDMIIRDNTAGDMYILDNASVIVSKDGLGDKAYAGVKLTSGVLTDAVIGAYNYTGGNLNYVITKGDRSITDPEYDSTGSAAGEVIRLTSGNGSQVNIAPLEEDIPQTSENGSKLDTALLEKQKSMSKEVKLARDKVVAKMNEMATVQWKPTMPMWYSCYGTDGCSNLYLTHQIVLGLPYNHMGGSIARLKYVLKEDGHVQDWVSPIGYDGFDIYLGADCSSAVARAWSTVSNSLDWDYASTAKQLPWANKGAIALGDYTWDYTGTSTTNYTNKVLTAAGEETIYEAYAQILHGDVITYLMPNGGHSRMATSDAVVYRNADGKIDPDSSYALFTQCGGVGRVVTVMDNQEYVTNWGVNEKYTFRQLFDTNYLPTTCEELMTGNVEESWVKLENSATVGKAQLCTGVVSSNYAIDYVAIEVKSEQGKTWSAVQFPGLSAHDDYASSDAIRTLWKQMDLGFFNGAVRNLHLRAGMRYECTISVTLMTGETKVVSSFVLTMPAAKHSYNQRFYR